MLGYVTKDLMILKKDAIFYILFIVIFSFFKTLPGNFLASIYCIAMVFNVFTYEEKDGTSGFLCSLPNGRKNLVISKYILFLMVLISMSIISYAIPTIISMVRGENLKTVNTADYIFICIPIFVASIIMPLVYQFGATRARIYLFLVFFLTSFSAGYLLKAFPELKKFLMFLENRMYIILIFALVLYVISYFISLRINDRKDY